MAREGIIIPDKSTHVSFTSPKRLDMRSFKERGLIRSYSISRVRFREEVVEEA
jgi:ribosomal protein S14